MNEAADSVDSVDSGAEPTADSLPTQTAAEGLVLIPGLPPLLPCDRTFCSQRLVPTSEQARSPRHQEHCTTRWRQRHHMT